MSSKTVWPISIITIIIGLTGKVITMTTRHISCFLLIPLVQNRSEKNAHKPIRALFPKKSLSKRSSGWFIGFFSFECWTGRGGRLKTWPSIKVSVPREWFPDCSFWKKVLNTVEIITACWYFHRALVKVISIIYFLIWIKQNCPWTGLYRLCRFYTVNWVRISISFE